uniref:Uncharacterized protein n=2 Tax=Cajanus cajan TaxID=3821 RepID=A0A151SQE7_CAJCA|nr:hypothetical protein KK1_003230 [Cajanus cajan]
MLRSRRRRKMVKRGLLQLPAAATVCTCGACEQQRVHPMCAKDAFDVKRLYAAEADNDNDKDDEKAEVLALEKEMWDQFFSTGFWRSSSNRESSQLSAP